MINDDLYETLAELAKTERIQSIGTTRNGNVPMLRLNFETETIEITMDDATVLINGMLELVFTSG